MLVDESGSIIAGHGRVPAAKKLGFLDVPVMVASGWTEAQRRAYVLADNRLALDAGCNEDLLRSELVKLGELGVDLPWTGFSEAVLGKLLPRVEEGDADHITPVPVEPVTRAGDLWILGDHRVLFSDSTDSDTVAHLLSGETPHLMVTDLSTAWSMAPSGASGQGCLPRSALAGSRTIIGQIGERLGPCSQMKSPMSGMLASTPPLWPRASLPQGSPCAHRSSKPGHVWS